MTKKKIKTDVPYVKPQVWQEVARQDAKYNTYTVDELIAWIKANTPKDTPFEDIKISFDVNECSGYYDDVIVDVEMVLWLLQ